VTRFHGYKRLQILFFQLTLIGVAAAAPDPRLLSLVPPGAQLVAGISASMFEGQPHNFVLMTQNNWFDLQDFFALTGADDTRSIHQIVFVEVASKEWEPSGHSLLVSGHFDQSHVFKSAADNRAAVANYRGIPLLEIQPFVREHGKFNGVRWLAVLDSRVLIFGSIAITKLELDRYLARSETDESLLRRLGRLRSKDQTWCLLLASSRTLPSLTRGHEIQDVLAELNPELAEFTQPGNEFEFGLHYGRRVEFEYEVTFASSGSSRVGSDSLTLSAVEHAGSTSLLPNLNRAGDANTLHGVIAVSMSRYKEWLEEIKRAKLPSD
jgi:hypothetical protein